MAIAEYMVPADLQLAIQKITYKTNKSRVSTKSEVENGLPHTQVFAMEA